jgi:hypothetical protein
MKDAIRIKDASVEYIKPNIPCFARPITHHIMTKSLDLDFITEQKAVEEAAYVPVLDAAMCPEAMATNIKLAPSIAQYARMRQLRKRYQSFQLMHDTACEQFAQAQICSLSTEETMRILSNYRDFYLQEANEIYKDMLYLQSDMLGPDDPNYQ